mmetsp:Transcript_258/g.467  ORF Transcript_258/g.467 Transcript_258/m.467 type:complete len:255 (-) Transcript_258:664-1428(-)
MRLLLTEVLNPLSLTATYTSATVIPQSLMCREMVSSSLPLQARLHMVYLRVDQWYILLSPVSPLHRFALTRSRFVLLLFLTLVKSVSRSVKLLGQVLGFPLMVEIDMNSNVANRLWLLYLSSLCRVFVTKVRARIGSQQSRRVLTGMSELCKRPFMTLLCVWLHRLRPWDLQIMQTYRHILYLVTTAFRRSKIYLSFWNYLVTTFSFLYFVDECKIEMIFLFFTLVPKYLCFQFSKIPFSLFSLKTYNYIYKNL